MLSKLDTDNIPSSQLHQQNLQELQQSIPRLKSNKTCLFCLRRKPEHTLVCRHSMCDVCVRRYGTPMRGIEYHFEVSKCILCQSEGPLGVKLLPPTAGTRLLAIDGGGVRGELSLLILRNLEQVWDLPYPLQDDFDFALGTSSGRV